MNPHEDPPPLFSLVKTFPYISNPTRAIAAFHILRKTLLDTPYAITLHDLFNVRRTLESFHAVEAGRCFISYLY